MANSHAATGEPDGEVGGVMAGLAFFVLGIEARRTKLSTADHLHVVEQTLLVEILQQCRNRRIGGFAVGGQVAAVVLVLVRGNPR